MFYKKSKNRQPGSAFLEYLEAQILNIPQIGASHDGALNGFCVCPGCPKIRWVRHVADESSRMT